jgi:hypothetical protein
MLDRLKYLAQGYFHEDYDVVSGTPLDVIRDFAAHETLAIKQELMSDIDSLLASHTEAQIGHLWLTEWGASYEPPHDDGITYRQWFEKVLEVLREQT